MDWKVRVIEREQMDAYDKREADQIAAGVRINLNHADYYVEVIPTEGTTP